MILNALKWAVKFLETRFPEKVTPVSQEEYQAAIARLSETNTCLIDATAALKRDIEKIQKQIEVLNLRVGLARPIPHGLMEKRNG